MARLIQLQRISRALKPLESPAVIRELTKDAFQAVLQLSYTRFYDKLRKQAVSKAFRDTLASRILLHSFNKDLSLALRTNPKTKGLRFALGIRSTGGTDTHSDPAAYYDAINDASVRQGGPSINRVKQWLHDRGFIDSPNQKFIYFKDNGRKVDLTRYAFIVQRTIARKTRSHAYKSLELTDVLMRAVDVKNPNSPLRRSLATIPRRQLQRGWKEIAT